MGDVDAGRLHRVARILRAIATAATTDSGEPPISAGDLAIVEDVAYHEGTSVGEIAGRTRLAQSLVSKTVARMRDAGVFVTDPDPGDRRRVLIRVAPATRAGVFRSRAGRPIERAIHNAQPGASAADVHRIGELLDELAARLLSKDRR